MKTTSSRKNSKTITLTRLTQHVAAGGCAAKLGPADLQQILHSLPKFEHPDMLVGTETSDDAGVFRLRPDLAIVNTVDFFTPIVDDPYTFGQIAAANALSDIFAMGAEPTTALNIVAFPKRHTEPRCAGRRAPGRSGKDQSRRGCRHRRPQHHR